MTKAYFTHKYAFAVDTKEPDVAFAELAREPLFRRLLGPVLFGWQVRAQLRRLQISQYFS